jgi:hypothetical protein
MTEELNPREWDIIARIVARELRRCERRLEKSTFVPEPGHKNMTALRASSTREILRKVRIIAREAAADADVES